MSKRKVSLLLNLHNFLEVKALQNILILFRAGLDLRSLQSRVYVRHCTNSHPAPGSLLNGEGQKEPLAEALCHKQRDCLKYSGAPVVLVLKLFLGAL